MQYDVFLMYSKLYSKNSFSIGLHVGVRVLAQRWQFVEEVCKEANRKAQRSVSARRIDTQEARTHIHAHLSSHTACHCAKILYFCAKTCSIFKDGCALSVWLRTPWHTESILILRLIKCAYNQGLIVYWFPLWDTEVLNNAIPWALMQQQSPFILPVSGACDCCWVVIWFGVGQPGLSPLPDSSDSAEPSQPTCFTLARLYSFFFVNKVVR